jgi:predicted nucleic acid-binding protein
MKAYLDCNVVSIIAKDDTPSQSDAIRRLLFEWGLHRLSLVTSDVTLTEIEKYRGASRKEIQRVFRSLQRVPVIAWDKLLGIHSYGDQWTWINSPMIERDALYSTLLQQGLEVIDAQHVFVAARVSCDSFLTCDRGIVSRAAAINSLCNLAVQTPVEFMRDYKGFSPF